ncbi:MAG: hypothetical protein ACTSX8_07955 [Alphaproteobacteria bacterium]
MATCRHCEKDHVLMQADVARLADLPPGKRVSVLRADLVVRLQCLAAQTGMKDWELVGIVAGARTDLERLEHTKRNTDG